MSSNMIYILLMCITCSCAYRHVVQTLTASNGGPWGNWHSTRFCAPGQYAFGYKLKIERKQGSGDDTSLNGIEILCGTTSSRSIHGKSATSGVGQWGDWNRSFARCPKGQFLTSFKLQVERPIDGDDTSANFVTFRCRHWNGGNERQLSQGRGYGFWGDFGGWSGTCSLKSAICGLRTRVEGRQGSGDDTALNDVQFHCCDR